MTPRRDAFRSSLWAFPVLLLAVCTGYAAPDGGLTAAAGVSRAYDAVLDADVAGRPDQLATMCAPAPPQACTTLEAVALWWDIALDPDDRSRDRQFEAAANRAIDATEAWTAREPGRAEAWFYDGAAYGARVQWRVLRGEHLAAARDGKHIKESLETALGLDPSLYDAQFGVGLYRYYAAVAPSALRMLRWLLMLPGGDRAGGLEQMRTASERGVLVRGEADYQLHIVYLWYEHRFDDALRLIDSLRARYPRNPLFHQARASILDTYFHDPVASLRAWEDLRLRADAGLVNEAALAGARARIEAARILDALDETDRAVVRLEEVVAAHPARPILALPTAQALLPQMRHRLAYAPYRLALEGWRAFERGDHALANRTLTQALAADTANTVTRYRLAQVLLATDHDTRGLAELQRVVAPSAHAPAVTRANALFDLARVMEQRGDRTRARALYLDASRVFGADGALAERAAGRAIALDQPATP